MARTRAVRKGRQRFGGSELFTRQDSAKPLIRAIRQQGLGFFNLPDMDFGIKDAAFVPFFGVPAATLLAPSRMAKMRHDGAAGSLLKCSSTAVGACPLYGTASR